MNPTTDDLRRAGLTIKDGQAVKIPNHAATHALFKGAADERSHALKAGQPSLTSSFGYSPLEARFLDLWSAAKGPELVSQAALIPGRLYRVDFLHVASKTCIELQGIRDHTSRKGFARDCDKFFTLQVDLNYRVICLSGKMVTAENVDKIIARLK